MTEYELILVRKAVEHAVKIAAPGIHEPIRNAIMLSVVGRLRHQLNIPAAPLETAHHDLYKTGDKDAPDIIKDRNGEVVLELCRRCNLGEAELVKSCNSKTVKL